MKKLSLVTCGFVLASNIAMADIAVKEGWQMVGITNFTSAVSLFNESCVDYAWKYDISGETSEWKVYIANGVDYQHEFNTFNTLFAGDSIWVKGNDNCTISIEETLEHNGFTYKSVTSPTTGRTWLDRNLGATQACTAIDDSDCYGHYYQWGRLTDGHQLPDSNTTETQLDSVYTTSYNRNDHFVLANSQDWTTTDSDGEERIVFWSATHGTYGICPVGYRVPFQSEIEEEISYDIQNKTDLFNSFLKLPSAGFRSSNGTLVNVDAITYLWFNVTSSSSTSMSPALSSTTTIYTHQFYRRSNGMPVRCIKDN